MVKRSLRLREGEMEQAVAVWVNDVGDVSGVEGGGGHGGGKYPE